MTDARVPIRVRRKRTKGYRMPANTVSVCRPSRFGNPFSVAKLKDLGYEGTDLELQQRCVDAFRAWLCGEGDWQGEEADNARTVLLEGLKSLRGKNLACFCKLGDPCHADVLLEMANSEESKL